MPEQESTAGGIPDANSPKQDNSKQDNPAQVNESAKVNENAWPPPGKVLSPAARRALAEAEERRRAAKQAEEEAARSAAKEINGRKGPDPVRYGDWEVKGIISDF